MALPAGLLPPGLCTSQPQHPTKVAKIGLTSGMIGMVDAVSGGRDLVTGFQFQQVVGPAIKRRGKTYGQPTTATRAGGIATDRNIVTPNPANWKPATNKLSLVVVWEQTGNSAATAIGGQGLGTSGGYSITSASSNDGTAACVVYDSAGAHVTYSAANAIKYGGELNVAVMIADGNGGLTLWLNGVATQTGSPPNGTNIAYETTYSRVGLIDGGANGDFDAIPGYGYYMALWNRVLTVAEAQLLCRNPWAVYEPQRQLIAGGLSVPAAVYGSLGEFDPELKLTAWF